MDDIAHVFLPEGRVVAAGGYALPARAQVSYAPTNEGVWFLCRRANEGKPDNEREYCFASVATGELIYADERIASDDNFSVGSYRDISPAVPTEYGEVCVTASQKVIPLKDSTGFYSPSVIGTDIAKLGLDVPEVIKIAKAYAQLHGQPTDLDSLFDSEVTRAASFSDAIYGRSHLGDDLFKVRLIMAEARQTPEKEIPLPSRDGYRVNRFPSHVPA